MDLLQPYQVLWLALCKSGGTSIETHWITLSSMPVEVFLLKYQKIDSHTLSSFLHVTMLIMARMHQKDSHAAGCICMEVMEFVLMKYRLVG